MKKQNGITLIALVITIIVLLILAGVSISMVIGDNGIIKQANDAKTKTYAASEKEQVELAYLAAKTKNLGESVTVAALNEALSENQVDATATEPVAGKIEVVFSNGNKYTIEKDIVTATYSDSGITGGTDILKEMYSVDGITSEDIADTTLFDVSINSCGGEKEARIKLKSDVMKPTEDNWYKIDISGDKLVVPYEVEFEGEMYKVTEVDLITIGKETGYGFNNQSNIPGVKQLIYPNTVKRIIATYADGNGAEYFPLESVVLSNQLEEIPSYMFQRALKLTSITIPSSVTSIGSESFYGCTGLKNVTIENGVTSIGSGAFEYCTGLTNITIPSSVTNFGQNTFYGCTGLTNVTIENGVTSIGDWMFMGCKGLTNITIPSSVTSIGSSAFSGCTGLTNVTIENGVTSIGSSAFSSCTGITQIFIPKSVTTMGDRVFYNWTENQTINCEVSSKPDGWSSVWDRCDYGSYRYAKLYWGVTR